MELWGGIECTINRVGDAYQDQLEYCGHYERYIDLDLIAATGVQGMRYPVLWERHMPGSNIKPDFSFATNRLNKLRDSGIRPVVGLVHHGSGPRWVSFMDGSFEQGLAHYAAIAAKAFPWVKDWTPVNEPLTTARFCGVYRLWYPHGDNDEFFARILISECKGIRLAMKAIRSIIPEARLVHTEDCGKVYTTARLRYQADFENERRFLGQDLLCGLVQPGHPMWNYLRRAGIPEHELFSFADDPCPPDILGCNYYATSDRWLDDRIAAYPAQLVGGNGRHRYADVELVRAGTRQRIGVGPRLRETWNRYRIPLIVSEAHLHCHREDQLRWLYQIWNACLNLNEEGIPVQAVTIWAMLGSYGWNRLLTAPRGQYENGAFDVRCVDGPQATALAGLARYLSGKSPLLPRLALGEGWWQRDSRILYSRIRSKPPPQKAICIA